MCGAYFWHSLARCRLRVGLGRYRAQLIPGTPCCPYTGRAATVSVRGDPHRTRRSPRSGTGLDVQPVGRPCLCRQSLSSIHDAMPLVTVDGALQPRMLAKLLKAGFFSPSDGVEADSCESPHNRFDQEALRLATHLLLSDDEDCRTSIPALALSPPFLEQIASLADVPRGLGLTRPLENSHYRPAFNATAQNLYFPPESQSRVRRNGLVEQSSPPP